MSNVTNESALPNRGSILKSRFMVYGILIVLAVAIGLFFLAEDKPRGGGKGRLASFFGGRSSDPWKPSAKLDAEANADFSFDSNRTENVPLAGKKNGADWPQFNGTKRDNKSSETGLLKSWPKDGPELLWTSHGVGAGYSTVAVVDGVVYTMGNKGSTEAIIALDAGTGEKIWSTPIAWASKLSAGDGPRSTPTVANGAVYGMGGNGVLACLDAATGKVRWQKNIMDEFGGNNPGWGTCESVLIDGDKLICTPGGDKATVVALDRESGDVVWKSQVPQKDRAGYASAVISEAGGIRQYVQFTASGTIGVRADNGEFLWRNDDAANGTANCSSPQVTGNFVFSASDYGKGGALVKLAGSDSNVTAELVYHTDDMKSHHGDLVVVDGLLYGSSGPGLLTCLELETGKVKWHNRSVGKGSVTFADGAIYLRSEQGPIALVEATGEKYHELGKFDQPERSESSAWSHPVVAAGRLFLRDQDVLLCYDVKAK